MIEGSGSGRPKNMWIRWIWIRNTACLTAYFSCSTAFLSRTPFFPAPAPTYRCWSERLFRTRENNSLPDNNLLTGDINIVTWATCSLIDSYLTAISVLSTRSAICRSQKPSCFASSSRSLLHRHFSLLEHYIEYHNTEKKNILVENIFLLRQKDSAFLLYRTGTWGCGQSGAERGKLWCSSSWSGTSGQSAKCVM